MGQRKQSGLIGLYSGREIKTAATRSAGLTRTQTGKQALASIVSKYGSIVDNAKYFHIGKGEWRKYSLENDKKRTGSVTTDMNAWRRRPNKLDFQGIDTKQGPSKRPSKKFSVSQIKTPESITGRKEKSALKLTGSTVTKKMPKRKDVSVKKAKQATSKHPSKPSGRTSKAQLKASHKSVMKVMEKPKAKINLKNALQTIKFKTLKGRSAKVPIQKHVHVPKILDSSAYMKNSPYTKEQVRWYNNYSFYDVDINKEFNDTVNFMEAKVRKQYPNGVPPEVLKALARYRKAIYDSYLAESKARSTAPSQMVVGPAGYKNFDRKFGRANNIRQKALDDVHNAEKELKLSMQRVKTKDTINNIKNYYAVNIGDTVMLHWTNNYRKYNVPAKVVKINVNTIVGELLKDSNGYKKGQKISVPMNGTAGNRWSHIGADKPKIATNKELIDKYLAKHPSPFKVGDKVYNKGYRFTGTVIKMNKKTMIIKGEPTYDRDDGLRKVSNDAKVNIKL
jgi:hypothetical protein